MSRSISTGLWALTSVLLLAGCASPEPPAGEPKPFAGSPADYTQAVVDCLNDDGWGAEIITTESGDTSVTAPGVATLEQQQEFLAASSACTAALPPIPEARSDEELQEQYDHWIAQHACLTDAGYELPAQPSYQAYRDQLQSGEWISEPFGLLTIDPEELEAAYERCPPDPEAWW